MSSDRQDRLDEIFSAVLRLEPGQRAEYVRQACGGDDALRAEIESLLAHEEQIGSFLEKPVLEAVSTRTADNTPTSETLQIGRYRLLYKIGEGGMGEVWLAEQKEPVRRRVALKLIKAGMNTREVIARFESERQALALMDHPAIAKVFDAGSTPEGAPYFVMEYVAGVPITTFCDKHALSTDERLGLFMRVCEGVQHAHQKAIIHRDLKPSNILVVEVDGRPAPKIIDFGVAKALTQKLTPDTLFTRVGVLVGTPEYMSPEQADSSGEDIDTRTDVYSLAVIFYELLAGVPPLDLRKIAFEEFLRKLREEDPPKPSTKIRTQDLATSTEVARKRRTEPLALAKQISGDLDSIALKALEKDRSRRYASASEFAADVGRYLRDEPVLAGPPGRRYRIRKFARRNRGPVAAGIAILACLLFGLAVSTVMFVRAESARQEAERRGYVANLIAADLNLRSNDVAEARRRLLACPRALRGWEWEHLFLKSDFSIATLYTLDDSDHGVTASFESSTDGSRIFCNTEHTLYSWDAGTFLPTGRWSNFGSIVAVAPHAERVLAKVYTCCGGSETDHTLRVFDPFSHQLIATLLGHKRRVTAAAFTPDGARLLTGDAQGSLFFWDSSTGRLLSKPIAGNSVSPPIVVAIAFSHDGKRIAASYSDGTVRLWDNALVELWSARSHGNEMRSTGDTILAFTPDGRLLAAASGRSVRLWDATSGQRQLALDDFDRPIASLTFTPDGSKLLTGTTGGLVEVRDAHSGRSLATLVGHTAAVQAIGFDPRGQILTTDGPEIRVWNWSSFGGIMTLPVTVREYSPVALSPNGRFLAWTEDTSIRLWDTSLGKLLPALKDDNRINAIAFSPDSAHLASVSSGTYGFPGHQFTMSIWEIMSATRAVKSIRADGDALDVVFSPDGQRLAYSSMDKNGRQEVRFWDVTAGRPLSDVIAGPIGALFYTPDGLRIVTGFGPLAIRRSDSNQALVLTLPAVPPDARRALDVIFSSDGRRIAAFERFEAIGQNLGTIETLYPGSVDASLQIWDARSGKALMRLRGPKVPLSVPFPTGFSHQDPSVAFDPDGRRLFAAWGNLVQTWDAISGDPLLSLHGNDQPIQRIALTADGSRLASFSADGIVKIWDTRSAYDPEAESLVQSLFQKLGFAADVTERLRADATLEESLRRAALFLVQEQGEHDSVGHIRASWETAKAPGAGHDSLKLGLRHAQVACKLAPWNWEAFNARGAVEYRLGANRDALASLLHAAQMHGAPSISNLAFQALTYTALAQSERARAVYREAEMLSMSLDVRIKQPEPDLDALVVEAMSVVYRTRR